MAKSPLRKEILDLMISYDRVPLDFIDFVSNSFEKIMFYHKFDKKTYKGYCSCGAEEIILDKPKTGQYIICPHCGKKVRLKNDIFKGQNYSYKVCTYVDSLNDGFIQVIYIGHQEIIYDALSVPRVKVKVWITEEQRDYLSSKLKFYQIHPQYQYQPIVGGYTKTGRYIKGRAPRHGQSWTAWISEDVEMAIYPYNLDELIKFNSNFKYSCLKLFCENVKFNPIWYLQKYLKYPNVEKLLKVGLFNIVFDVINGNYFYNSDDIKVNRDGTTIESICGLKTKQELQIASNYNLTMREIKALQLMRNWKSKITYDKIKFMRFLISHSGSDFEYPFISNEKLYFYYEILKDKMTPGDFISDYADYIFAASELGMNLFDTKVKTPHDFVYCHDLCLTRHRELLLVKEKQDRIIRKNRFKELSFNYDKIFSFSSEKYTIVVSKTRDDLSEEGKNNCNCVGGYFDRIADGKSIVLFLRNSENVKKSFCTVELEPKNLKIIQCRTYQNGSAPESVIKWLENTINKIKLKYENYLYTLSIEKVEKVS